MILDSFRQDVRVGLRVLFKDKIFCFLAVLVLGLGIGGATTQFTVVNALVLRKFSFPHPEQLVTIGLIDPKALFGGRRCADSRCRSFLFCSGAPRHPCRLCGGAALRVIRQMIFESEFVPESAFLPKTFVKTLALLLPLNIAVAAVSPIRRRMHMQFRLIISVISIAFIAAIAVAQGKSEPTVDQLVAKNVEAKGGAAALHDLQTLRLAGKMLVQQGQIQYVYLQIKKRPEDVRTEASLQGMTQIEAYDGKEGWRVSPFFGRKDPERMSADDVKPLMEEAEIDGPLVDWKAKGSTIEYLGTEDVDGTLAHKLKVVRKNGDVSFVYLDPDHFLEIRVLTQRTRHGAYEEVETDLGDYEKAGGVFVPTSIESGGKGAPDKQRIIIDKVEANAPVDDTMFHFPASK